MGFLNSLFKNVGKLFGGVANAAGSAGGGLASLATKNPALRMHATQNTIFRAPSNFAQNFGNYGAGLASKAITNAGFRGSAPEEAPAQTTGGFGGLMDLFNNHPTGVGMGLMGASQLFGGKTK